MSELICPEMWHIALDESGALQTIVSARIPLHFTQAAKLALQTDNPAGKLVPFDKETGYLYMFDGDMVPPYPSVMIFKVDIRRGKNVLRDMGAEDRRAVPYAVEHFLRRRE